MRISNSGRTTFQTCGEKYRLHYQEKLRSPKIFSALFFGNALDAGFSRLLLDKKKALLPEELLQLSESADEIFYKSMCNVKRDDGTIVEASKSPFADYYASDYTPELLTPQAVALIQEYAPDVLDPLQFMESCQAVIKSKKKLSAEDVPLFNYITWLTLVEKGYLMLQAYRDQIMPQIHEVFSIQEAISIKTEAVKKVKLEQCPQSGEWLQVEYEEFDEITGLIDFTCDFVDEIGTMYVCDNKSSSKPYKASETGESAQLSTYCEAKQTNKAAYVVIEKKLYAKGPKIRTQVLKADIAEEQFSSTFADYENVVYSISTGSFEKNFKSCFSYGRMCAFFGLCKYKNAEGLIKKIEEVKDEQT